MLHDRSLRKGRDRSLTIERDRVRTHGTICMFKPGGKNLKVISLIWMILIFQPVSPSRQPS